MDRQTVDRQPVGKRNGGASSGQNRSSSGTLPVDERLLELTLPQLLVRRAEADPAAVAYRHKELGVWQEWSWGTVLERVQQAALGLLELGLERDDRVAILADNIPEWAVMELAAQSVGARSIGVYASSGREEVGYLLSNVGARAVLVEDQEQADKVLEQRGSLKALEHVIYQDPRGMRAYQEQPGVLAWDALLERGRAQGARGLERFRAEVAAGRPDDVAHLSTTSGTTGRPKAAMLSHRNYLAMAYALHQVDPLEAGDDYVSFLPFAWIVEQVFALGLGLLTGMVVNFPESAETAMEDLREIGPHMMLGAPRVWEGMQSQIWVKMNESYPFNRWLYARLMRFGGRAAEHRMRGQRLPPLLALGDRLAHAALYRPLKDQLGFLRLRRAYTGGAALGPDTFRFFHAMGVNLKQVYGQTETAGLAYVQRDGEIDPATVGKPLPGVELRIGESGEVMTRCAGVCHGYFGQDFAEGFAGGLEDGFFRSGDAGYLNASGDLVVIDRVADVMHTASGHAFSPMFIENKLKFSPFVKEAVVYGDGQAFLTALLNVDPLTVGAWAEERGLAYTTYADLSQNPAVASLLLREVEALNSSLPEPERLKRFVLLYKLLDADDEELTRTGKVRRGLIAERYAPILAALYDPSTQRVAVEAEFRYQDGQTVRLTTEVQVLEPAEPTPEKPKPGRKVSA